MPPVPGHNVRLDPSIGVSQIDFDPHDVVGRYPNKVLGAIGVFGGTVALTAGITAGIFALPDLGDPGTLHREQQELAVEQAQHTQKLEADNNLDRLQVSLGEGCVTLVERYMSGRPLAGTPENAIVSDLSNHPRKPCGDNPTDVRLAATRLFDAELAAYGSGERLAAEQNVIIDTDLSGYEDDVTNRQWPKGLIGGGILGVMIGIGTVHTWVQYAKDRRGYAINTLSKYLTKRLPWTDDNYGKKIPNKKRAAVLARDVVTIKMPELRK